MPILFNPPKSLWLRVPKGRYMKKILECQTKISLAPKITMKNSRWKLLKTNRPPILFKSYPFVHWVRCIAGLPPLERLRRCPPFPNWTNILFTYIDWCLMSPRRCSKPSCAPNTLGTCPQGFPRLCHGCILNFGKINFVN